MYRLAVVSMLACGQPARVAPKPKPVPPPVEPPPPAEPTPQLITKTPDQLEWKPLDETAGDKGPMFAALWGEMDSEPNGFFLKLPKDSPGTLHTHSRDYQGIVIAGTPSNTEDGQKKPAALPPQSYWFQPGGVAHTTACSAAADCVVYLEFLGKFDFAPAKPVKGAKLDPRYVEKRVKELRWRAFDKVGKGAQVAPLWGDPQSQPNGFLLKLKAGSDAPQHAHKSDYHAVVLAGTVNDLPVGSYWMQPSGQPHAGSCKAGADCVVYVHFTGAFD